ncbi:PREDICTED: uncharacterized protein DDB_G0271670 [Fragaria vesca subsp. vesca]|uniref:uncharacterized protein DDB_G0271670 n=1 Tax=Fragaria vesca subsp. vesca TaxID=101020 RepID=UPI0002C35482|nr:PREDICTED: uncharacterized protein DDB_G0271670 [Fragaria vesca subsp. vesca]
MDQNKKQVGAPSHSHGSSSSSSSSSSTTTNLDHLFGPRDSSTSSASSSLFSTIFPPPSSTGPGRDRISGNATRGSSKSSVYQNNEGTDPPCNFNSSIYYGGQENYNVPKSGSTYESKNHQHNFKKDGGDDDESSGSNSNSTSRGNWWKGSLYY